MPSAGAQAPDLDEALLRKHRRVLGNCHSVLTEFNTRFESGRDSVSPEQRRRLLSALLEVTEVVAEMAGRQEEIKRLLARATQQFGAVSAYARVQAIKGGVKRNIRH